MDVISPPAAAGGSAKSIIPNLYIALIREWYLTYVDLLEAAVEVRLVAR